MFRIRRRGTSRSVLGIVLCLGAVLGAPRRGVAEEPAARTAPSGRLVSLSEMLDYAAQHAPALLVAEERRGLVAAERAAASPLFRANPTLEFGIGPRFDDASEVDFDFFAAVAQPVGISGERGRRKDAAARLGDRLGAEASVARLEVRREVMLAYYGAALGDRQAALARRVATFADEMFTTAKRRLSAGDATAIDVRIAETDLVSAQQALLAAEADRASAIVRLAEVSGWPLATPLRVVAELPEPGDPPPLPALLESAAAQHPELAARRAKVAESDARVEVAKREGWPTPVLGAQVAREGSAGSPANYIVLGTVGLTLPVWQRNQGELAGRRVDRDVARAEAALAERARAAAVARAHVRLSAASERLRLYPADASSGLDSSLALLERGVDAGEFSLLDVAVARERFLSSERAALAARADYYAALVELEFAVGAGAPENAAKASPSEGGAP